ncbi:MULTISPECIES: hypothetical protein [unclassified Streptomyces]|uniref:DUF6197 family protein n=1 Tax=unclassified Streptomyces TaxID=2593676 RepID=UPI0038165CBD
MPTPTLTPDQLDAQAARLHDTEAWQQIVTGWEVTAPDPVQPLAPTPAPVRQGSAAPVRQGSASCPVRLSAPGATESLPDRRSADWRDLLSVPVEQLIADSARALPATAPRERPLPGRLGAILPDRLHSWRRIGQPEVRPSTHLAYARQILTEWGWQNTPYRLRNARGARCICGALLTAHRLGYGSLDTVDRAGAWLVTELRSQGWTGLIGPWNRCPGRTAADALALIDATITRAAHAGQ